MATTKIVKEVRKLNGAYEDPDRLIIIGLDPLPPGIDPEELAQYEDDHERHDPPLEGLIQSIMTHGVNDPITCVSVRAGSGDRYRIVVNGRQRTLAAREANRRMKKAGGDHFIEVPYVTKNDSDGLTVVISNEFRKPKSPLARAREAQRLLKWGKSKAEVRAAFAADDGKTISAQTLENLLSLLKLSAKDQERLTKGELGLTEAYALAQGKAPPSSNGASTSPGASEGEVGPSRPRGPKGPPRPSIRALVALAEKYSPSETEPYENDTEPLVYALISWVTTGDTAALDKWPEIARHVAEVTKPSVKAKSFVIASEEM